MRTSVPEDDYIRKLGLVVFLVASVEGLVIHDLPRFQHLVPPELNLVTMAGMTTKTMGKHLVAHAPRCTDPQVAEYLAAGGKALIEIAPLRNAMLHSRPATDGDDPREPLRLLRWQILTDPQKVHMITDVWLDRLIERIDEIQIELNGVRPPLGYT